MIDHERASEIFLAACERPSDARAEFVRSACGGDAALHREVESLLESEDETFLEAGISGEPVAALLASNPDAIADYEIVRTIGEGGMGVVYEAVQSTLGRRVAIKVIRSGLATPAARQRFLREAEALARLQHPGLVAIYDVGSTAGTPYIAMELVDGVRLDDWIRRDDPPRSSRIEIIARIADAVHHMHERGIVHRDLKPANVLVEPGGQPRVVDLGVVQLVGEDVRSATLRTDPGQLVGTVPYMSPEQVSGGTTDRATDVWAVGVMTFEMLTGRLPHDLVGRSLPEAARIVRDEEPTRLGARDRTLRGDLETVVATALAQEPDRRYASAGAFGADLRRVLRHEPIAARRPSPAYRLRKFARRHRAIAAGVLLVFVTLGAGLAGTLIALSRALDAEAELGDELGRTAEALARAETEATRTGVVTNFFQDMLAGADPETAQGAELTVRELLDRTASGLDDALFNDAAIAAPILGTLGRTYFALGDHEQSRVYLEQSLAKAIEHYGADHEEALTMQASLAVVLRRAGEAERAEAMLAEAVAGLTRRLGASSVRTLTARMEYAVSLTARGELSRAEREFEAAVGEMAGDPGHPLVLELRHNLASLLVIAGRHAEAVPLLESVIVDRIARHGRHSPRVLNTRNSLARALLELGRLDEAVLQHDAVVEGRTAVFGAAHADTLGALNNLAVILGRQGRPAGAAARFRDLAARLAEAEGQDAANTLAVRSNLAGALQKAGAYDEAEQIYLDILAIRERTLAVDHPSIARTRVNLAGLYRKLERYDEAEATLRSAVASYETTLGTGHLSTLIAHNNLAHLVLTRGRHDDALALFAETWRRARESLPPEQWDTPFFEGQYGYALLEAERHEEALGHLESALRGLQERLDAGSPYIKTCARNVARALEALDRSDEARRYRELAGDP